MTRALPRAVVTSIAAGRLGLGLVAVARPEWAARCWLGPDHAGGVPARVFGRALGGRDVALALGALATVRTSDAAGARRWALLGGLADSVDAVATLMCWADLPRAGRIAVVLAAGGAAAAGLAAAGRL